MSSPSNAWHKWALLPTDEISNTEPVAPVLVDRQGHQERLPAAARRVLSLTEVSTRRRAVVLGGPIAVSVGAIWASESFTITGIIGSRVATLTPKTARIASARQARSTAAAGELGSAQGWS